MKNFRRTLFRGYRKSEVDGYIESLIQDMEDYRTETEAALKKERQRTAETEERLRTAKEENAGLSVRIAELEQKGQKEREQLALKAQEQKKENEKRYQELAGLLADARIEASQIVSEAKARAEEIVREAEARAEETAKAAREDAKELRGKAQAEADRIRAQEKAQMELERESQRETFEMAKKNLARYLDGLNHSQRELIDIYNGLGLLVKKMPVRIEDMFSEQPFVLLDERAQKPDGKEIEILEEGEAPSPLGF